MVATARHRLRLAPTSHSSFEMSRTVSDVSFFVTVLLAAAGAHDAAAEPPVPQRAAEASSAELPPSSEPLAGTRPDVPTGDPDELGAPPPPPPVTPGRGGSEPRSERGASGRRDDSGADELVGRGGDRPREPPPPTCQLPCDERGACAEQDGRCVVAGDGDCEVSLLCRVRGQCTALNGRCVATSEQDCERSADCANSNLCGLNRDDMVCVERSPERFSPALMGVGISGIAVGGLALLAGLTLAALDRNRPSGASVALMVGGGLGLAAGIPATVVGARRAAPALPQDPFEPSRQGPVAGLTLSWEL